MSQYWEDRLLRVKALGLNVVQTYVPWNLHQPQADLLRFEKNTTTDLEGFLKLAQQLDLLVMLRPGPYICGGTALLLLTKMMLTSIMTFTPYTPMEKIPLLFY